MDMVFWILMIVGVGVVVRGIMINLPSKRKEAADSQEEKKGQIKDIMYIINDLDPPGGIEYRKRLQNQTKYNALRFDKE